MNIYRYCMTYRVTIQKSVILTFKFVGTSSDSIIKQICNAIIIMTATGQFVALWMVEFEQMATVWEKGSSLRILGIFSYFKLRFWNVSCKFILLIS